VRTGTASAELAIADAAGESLKQGQLGQVIFNINERESFVVPENAVIYREGKPYVRILEKNRVRRIPVSIAANLGDRIEIASGVKENEQVITHWSRFISDDEEVDVQKSESATKGL